MTNRTGPFGMPPGYWQAGIGLDEPTAPIHRTESELARKTYAYGVWRKTVLKRDGYACQSCGNDEMNCPEAHHRVSFAKFPEQRFVVANGVTLCATCHSRTHREARLSAQ